MNAFAHHNQRGDRRRGPQRAPREKSEFDSKLIDLARVARVTKGGKRFSFRATMVIGDGKGRVGVAAAKGLDVVSAVEKAKRKAQKEMITVPIKNNRTINHDVEAKYSAAKVRIKPAGIGHGLIAGGACRVVLELAGIKDISAKILGRTPNKMTNAMATIEALKKLKLQYGTEQT